ncbi:MAG TPA: ABC transporter ATP-binding protein [Pseudogracilibacillus sp.]|nr:ABC transporter ATP-binding protein [Pseudogracilibacillus sp.]
MKLIFKKLSPYKWTVVFVFILVFAQALSNLLLPTLMGNIVDNGVVKGDISYIWKIGGVMLGVSIVTVFVAVMASYFSSKVAMSHGRDLRYDVFSHVQEFSLEEMNEIGSASLMTRTTNDVTQIQRVMMMMLRMVIRAPLMMAGGIVMAVSKDAKLSLIVLGVIPFIVLAIFLILKYAMPLFKAVQNKLDRLNLVMRENLSGVRVIRAFNKEEVESERLKESNADLTGTLIKVNKLMAFLMPLMMLLMNVTVVAIIYFGGLRISHGNMQIGDLMAFIQYVMQIMFALVMASMMFVMLPRAAVSSNRVKEVLKTSPSIMDEPQRQKVSETEKGLLTFEHVDFHYPGAEEAALKDINFSTKPGEVTAIIGGTGAGKSTLVNLIPRFFDVTEGRVLVNGLDVRAMPQAVLRSKIGLVPQQAFLFSGSIADNIRYGKTDASLEEVEHAAKVAQADEFIQDMEDGYEAYLDPEGSNLSGGQKQRLAMARALVRQPDIYLFDDSFSALDFKTDKLVREGLKQEVEQATIVLVAQRVSSVRHADQIIVLDYGRVDGIGTHEELLQSSAIYQEIVASQEKEESA